MLVKGLIGVLLLFGIIFGPDVGIPLFFLCLLIGVMVLAVRAMGTN